MNRMVPGVLTLSAAALMFSAASTAQAVTDVRVLPESQIEAIDRIHMTLTVKELKQGNQLMLDITPHSRFFLNCEPAVTRDLEVGDRIKCAVRAGANGDVDLVRLYDQGLG